MLNQIHKTRLSGEQALKYFQGSSEFISLDDEFKKISCLKFFSKNFRMLLVNRSMKIKMLNLMRFFLDQLIEAMTVFYYEKNMIKFDPHVGDTLCQIRAYKILLLCHENRKKNLTFVKQELAIYNKCYLNLVACLAKFEELERTFSKYHKDLDSPELLDAFLKRNKLIFSLTEDMYFLMQSYTLSKYSVIDGAGISRGINYQQICSDYIMSKTCAKRLMRGFQVELSKYSCRFIFSLIEKLEESNFKELKSILPFLLKADDDRREVLPCYEATKILWASLISKKMPVFIIAEAGKQKYEFLFRANGKDFELCDKDQFYSEEPCLIIRGITQSSHSELLWFFKTNSLSDIFLSNMAMHPQYSAPELEAMSNDPYISISNKDNRDIDRLEERRWMLSKELFEMKKYAVTNGCYNEEPKKFVVKHIFCDYPNVKENVIYSEINKSIFA